jgi:hypothetical protein
MRKPVGLSVQPAVVCWSAGGLKAAPLGCIPVLPFRGNFRLLNGRIAIALHPAAASADADPIASGTARICCRWGLTTDPDRHSFSGRSSTLVAVANRSSTSTCTITAGTKSRLYASIPEPSSTRVRSAAASSQRIGPPMAISNTPMAFRSEATREPQDGQMVALRKNSEK